MMEQLAIDGITAALLARAERTCTHLTEAIIAREAESPDPASLPQLRPAQAAMVAKVAQMPPHLKLGMAILTLSFTSYARARTGRSLSALPIERRLSLLEDWRTAPLGPCRQFVQFYEKMGTFLYYSLVEESIMPPVEVR
jgi:hypothetical protein